jgi:uncharacterized membrane protein YczE
MRETSISEYVIALLELAEAEGRELKKQTLKVGFSLGLMLVAFGLIFTAFGFLIWGLFIFLTTQMSHQLAAFTLAGIIFLVSFIVLGIAKWKSS